MITAIQTFTSSGSTTSLLATVSKSGRTWTAAPSWRRGVTVDAETVFQTADVQAVDADTFFGIVATDSLVKAEGTYNGTSILADKLFLRVCQNSCL